jgi:starch phosphorylase
MVNKQVSFATAREAVVASNIFTTHTPVPAGNDAFEPWLIDRYFGNFWGQLGLTREQFLALGRQDPNNAEEPMSLTVLALHLSSSRNGVSALHGQVSRKLWSGVWPGLPADEVPIHHITNGVHTSTWISYDLAGLFDRYMGPDWQEGSPDPRVWKLVEQIPEAELWRVHERRRERMVTFVRHRLREQANRRGASSAELTAAEEVLDPQALTIGFARRFATYKRANLLLQDIQRLDRLLSNPKMPVQIIFAGKAHPRDNPGKDLIRQIVHSCRKSEFARKLVFIEDYDMNVARYLVQGVDIWLNTPLRPMEASGTSGMKAAANGAMNLSVRDGWWDEGYEPDVGWAIGSGETYEDLDYQNVVESQALYDLLEKEIVPLFYDRTADGLPRHWTQKMKSCIGKLIPVFNTNRMVREYTEKFYVPAMARWRELTAQGLAGARTLSEWKQLVTNAFSQVRVESVNDNISGVAAVGRPMRVEATVILGQVKPQDVSVQLYFGQLDTDGQLPRGQALEMTPLGNVDGDGRVHYAAEMPCERTGLAGYTVRILPRNPALPDGREMGLIRWA